jgi:uncharacterized coiled-coil protein SlyX
MEVGSPEWIEASLARLDDLERQRGEHEAAIEAADDPAVLKEHTAALEQLDAEIKTLYAQLEAVAEEDEDEGEEDEATEAAAPQVTTSSRPLTPRPSPSPSPSPLRPPPLLRPRLPPPRRSPSPSRQRPTTPSRPRPQVVAVGSTRPRP